MIEFHDYAMFLTIRINLTCTEKSYVMTYKLRMTCIEYRVIPMEDSEREQDDVKGEACRRRTRFSCFYEKNPPAIYIQNKNHNTIVEDKTPSLTFNLSYIHACTERKEENDGGP